MLKKTMTYTDFNGVERTEDFYFHLTEAEIADMELNEEGGLAAKIERIVNSKDTVQIKDYFQWFLLKSYGEKSEDGRRFMKTPELTQAFKETQAYSDLWMEMISDANAASTFIAGVVPKSVVKKAKEENPEAFKAVTAEA